MPSQLEFYAFPRLKSAKKEVNCNHLDYQSGASFSGDLDGVKRCGFGTFTWPSGDRYSGHYLDNTRHGKGEQTWRDGSKFTGNFLKDTRHGYGEHVWRNGESYKGDYFKDHRHGEGVYTWPDGSTFKGTFYKNRKEGYGTFMFASGNKFEGLYKEDERHGPGILTYPNGSQDIGIWCKERLVKLCTVIEDAFTMSDYPDFEYEKEERLIRCSACKTPAIPSTSSSLSDVQDISGSEEGAGDASFNLKEVMHALTPENFQSDFQVFQSSSQESVDLTTLTYDQMEYDKAFFGPGFTELRELEAIALNFTPSFMDLQRHILKHETKESTMSFCVQDVLRGERGQHGEKGPIEVASEALITAAAKGDKDSVLALIMKGAVNVNVADARGHTALLSAAVFMHQDVINLLLDNGADVNKLNNEGVSALSACHVIYYPPQSFKYNIAERYLPEPPEEKAKRRLLRGEDSDEDSEKSEKEFESKESRSYTGRSSQATIKSFSSVSSLTDSVSLACDSKENITQTATGIQGPQITEKDSNGGVNEEELEGEINDNDFYDLESVKNAENQSEQVAEWDPKQSSSEERLSLRDNRVNRVSAIPDGSSEYQTEVTESVKVDPLDGRDSYSLPDFESNTSIVNYGIKVTDEMVERCATVMSQNKGIVSRQGSGYAESNLDEARKRAVAIAEHSKMASTIRLLLKRGADPNASCVPMPVTFFAIKAADVDSVKNLLDKGAATSAKLSLAKEGLSPIHIASALRGPEGVEITKLILQADADPNARSLDDDEDDGPEELLQASSSNSNTKLRPGLDDSVYDLLHQLQAKSQHRGGRTPLHIACDRDDDYELARQVVRLLLEKGADPNVLCMGQSPLSLAIASGNDLAIDELLAFGASPSLPLGPAVGSALCAASNTGFEFRRNPDQRIALIDKLVDAGANILAPVPVGIKKQMGTAVDYAYWMFNQDRRIAHMPYHALTPTERDTYNARRKLLAHMGDILRDAAVRRERERLEMEVTGGIRSISPSQDFLYTGAGAHPSSGNIRPKTIRPGSKSTPGNSLTGENAPKQVVFHTVIKDSSGRVQPLVDKEGVEAPVIRKPLFKYCYECGRTLGVRLSACTRCKEVYYCSKACKVKAWNARHKEECVRVGGRSRSPSPSGKQTSEGGNKSTHGDSSHSSKNGKKGSSTTASGSNPSKATGKSNVALSSGSDSGKRGSVGSNKDGGGATRGGGNSAGGGGGNGTGGVNKGAAQGQSGRNGVNNINGPQNGNKETLNRGEVFIVKREITENYSYN